MKTTLAVLAATIAVTPAGAQQTDPHAGHRESQQSPAPPSGTLPEAAFSGPRHAADVVFDPADMAAAREQLRAEHGAMRSYGLVFDRLEMPIGGDGGDYAWEAQAWYGGDLDRIRIKSEGEDGSGGEAEAAEVQALWSRAIATWFDLQAGIRYDWHPEPDRGYLVLGLQGLMPYRFELDAAAFISEEGDFSARLEAEYDLLITQRLILQPATEIELAFQDVPESDVGRGISGVELGLRLRYELAREFAPYAGVQWERKLGRTADFARLRGESRDDFFVVAGVNFRF